MVDLFDDVLASHASTSLSSRPGNRRAAGVVGLEQAGRIGAGCWADLLFVDGDPVKDLGVLMSPKGVYVRGAASSPTSI